MFFFKWACPPLRRAIAMVAVPAVAFAQTDEIQVYDAEIEEQWGVQSHGA